MLLEGHDAESDSLSLLCGDKDLRKQGGKFAGETDEEDDEEKRKLPECLGRGRSVRHVEEKEEAEGGDSHYKKWKKQM